jgi:peptidoglycan/LPS O-acetylase OafA/YrhL
MTTERAYQPELDGLRALAVMAVLLCHLEFDWLPGGFVGVDIFFVLSGFLITRLIATEIRETGRFRFGNFYVRRVRRLYPALVTTVIVTWMGSFLLFSPQQMAGFAQSAIAALFSFSNVLFYAQADYFDALATTKPLLHTWSLSVEEQFYLLWPLTLLLTGRFFGRRGMFAVVAVLAAASLLLAQYWLSADSAAAFYMLPARAAELGMGGLLVFLPELKRRSLLNAATLGGIVAMLVPMVIYTEATPFPGLAALLPSLGAALFIAGAKSDAAAAFRLAPVAWLGRISYSLYLVHWPVIVLWRAYFYRPIETADALLLGSVSVLLAWAQYALVEQRFRRPVPGRNRPVITALAAIALLISGTSVAASLGGGWAWRVPGDRLVASSGPTLSADVCRHRNPDFDPKLVTCQNFRGKDKDLFVWGDSHALHLATGMSAAFEDYNVYLIYSSACPPQSGFGGYVRDFATRAGTRACVAHNRKAFEFLRKRDARSSIVITGAKRNSPKLMAKVTMPILAALREAGHSVAFLGDFMRPGVNLVDCTGAPAYLVSDAWIDARCKPDDDTARRELAYNAKMSKLVPDFISTNPVQCPGDACQFFEGRKLLFQDDHHLNELGSTLFVGRLRPLLPF